jgi:hypothetical protein
MQETSHKVFPIATTKTFLFSAVLLLWNAGFSELPAQTTGDTINKYFAVLKKDFDNVAANRLVLQKAAGPAEKLFVKELKRHQPFYAFIRTNSKGRVVAEMVRGDKENPKNRNISDQTWYKEVSRNLEEYQGSVLEDNGRYYLFWSKPLLKYSGTTHKKIFSGAVAVKIDLWDCFREISENTANPFWVRLNKRSLFSNKWKNDTCFAEDTLFVPGAKLLILQTDKKPMQAALAPTPAASINKYDATAKSVSDVVPNSTLAQQQNAKKNAVVKKGGPSKTILLILAVLILIAIIYLIIKLVSWFNVHNIMRKIDKDDSL